MSKNEYDRVVGEWIRRQREQFAMTQAELAAELRVSEASISIWEAGSASLSSYNHAKLKALFKARLERLV